MLWYQEDELTLDQRRRQSYYAIDPDSDTDVIIEEEEGIFRERCIITKGNE